MKSPTTIFSGAVAFYCHGVLTRDELRRASTKSWSVDVVRVLSPCCLGAAASSRDRHIFPCWFRRIDTAQQWWRALRPLTSLFISSFLVPPSSVRPESQISFILENHLAERTAAFFSVTQTNAAGRSRVTQCDTLSSLFPYFAPQQQQQQQQSTNNNNAPDSPKKRNTRFSFEIVSSFQKPVE